MLERLALERAVAIGDLRAQAAARRERDHLVGRKRPLGQDLQHLAAHVAGGADHCDLVTHCLFSKNPEPRGADRQRSRF